MHLCADVVFVFVVRLAAACHSSTRTTACPAQSIRAGFAWDRQGSGDPEYDQCLRLRPALAAHTLTACAGTDRFIVWTTTMHPRVTSIVEREARAGTVGPSGPCALRRIGWFDAVRAAHRVSSFGLMEGRGLCNHPLWGSRHAVDEGELPRRILG
jgi:hypothetical protein